MGPEPTAFPGITRGRHTTFKDFHLPNVQNIICDVVLLQESS